MLFKKIKLLCSKNNITITELERNLKFGNGTIHKWDIAQPSVQKVKLVADYFNVGVDYLVNDSFCIPNRESMEVAKDYEILNESQKALIKGYLMIFKNEQAVKKEVCCENTYCNA